MEDKRDYALKIVKGDNGYYCEWWDEFETGVFQRQVHVIEDEEFASDETKSMRQLLLFVKDKFKGMDWENQSKDIIIEVVGRGKD